MARSNYEILGLPEGADEREVQRAFRRLALLYHSDRGGDEERFMEIKRAYDDLRAGRARQSIPPGPGADDSAESIRRNTELAREVARDMREAESWAASLAAAGSTGTRLFGSSALGEMELERRPNGVLSIKGRVMAGTLRYDGPITVAGAITSPTRGAYAERPRLQRSNPSESRQPLSDGVRLGRAASASIRPILSASASISCAAVLDRSMLVRREVSSYVEATPELWRPLAMNLRPSRRVCAFIGAADPAGS